jgi:hypothetical protein
MAYQPNFNDPRVQSRIEKALTFVGTYVKHTPNWLSTRAIDKHFGQGQLDLSKWLRQQLLICEDSHWNHLTGKCKTYRRNEDGYQKLSNIINPKSTVAPALQQQLTTGEFEYTEKSQRLWNPIQYMPKRVKRPLLAKNGFNYNYDICCCAPTLILQYARTCGLTEPTPCMDLYVSDRTSIRNKLADETDLTTDEVKFVINVLLHGACISHNRNYSCIPSGVNFKHESIKKLKSNEFITSLREEIKLIWSAIKPHRKQKTITDVRGITRKLPLSGKDKSEVYREQEQLVLKEIQRYLKKTKNKALLEHDGWTCMNAIDIDELRVHVRNRTGYVIELDWEIYE